MYFDRNTFEEHVLHYSGKFEERRKNFLNRFYMRLLLSIAVIILVFFLSDKLPETEYAIHAYAIIVAVSAALTLHPILAYRNNTQSFGGVVELKVSLKEFVFSNIFNFFGPLSLHQDRGISLQAIKDAPLLQEYDEINMEDRISGKFEGVHLEMSEAEFIRKDSSRKAPAFKGMVIMLDISETDNVLRAPFNGNTILLQDEAKHLEQFKENYSEYQQVPLPTEEYENRFEVVSTAAGEVKSLFNEAFLDSLLKLAASLKASATTPAQEVPANETPAQALSHDIHCSIYADKLLITVPYDHDLFESNSLFKPAMVEEDKEMIFGLMEALAEIAHTITADTQ